MKTIIRITTAIKIGLACLIFLLTLNLSNRTWGQVIVNADTIQPGSILTYDSIQVDSVTLTTDTIGLEWQYMPTQSVISSSITLHATNNGIVGMLKNNNLIKVFYVYIIPVTGIVEQEAQQPLILYPNPARDILNVSTTQSIITIQITDMTGRILSITNHSAINCSALADGMYFVKILTNKGLVSKSFIKKE